MHANKHAAAALLVLLSGPLIALKASEAPVPLIAAYDMEPDGQDASKLTDSGPQHLHGRIAGAVFADGHSGKALKLDGPNMKAVVEIPKEASARASTGLTLEAGRSPFISTAS